MSGFSLAALKNTLDEVRVQVYAKNETEKKVYEALSSKNWGASSTMLNDIAADTSDYEKFGIINEIVWASLETEGKSWKQIFKSLTLIDFLIKNGSERFIEASRDKLFKIKRLQDYNFYEGTIDKGSGCREKAKQIVELLSSNEIIRSEREKARTLRNKFGGVGSDSRSGGGGGGGSYGGSYGGSSDSYGNQGIDSRDGRPTAGANGRYGGEGYGDSYSSNANNSNDRYGGSGGGSNSYSDRGGHSGSSGNTNTGRYGGGAYDSDKPPRYGDDAPSERYDSGSGSNNNRRASAYDRNDADIDDIKPYKPKDSSKDSANTATGGKLKVSIRKSTAGPTGAPAAQPQPQAQEVNLMGDDFDAFSSAPAPAAAPTSSFDPFGMSAPAAPAAAPAAAFDPFGMSAPAPAPVPAHAHAAFDPFNAPAAVPQSYAQAPAPAFDPFNQPPQQQFQQQQQPAYQQQQNFAPQPIFNAAPVPQYQQQPQQFQQQPQFQQAPSAQVQQQFRANPPPATAAHADSDFGDFEGAKPAAPAKAAPVNKWGDLGSLVDLGGISKNQPVAAKTDGNAAANAAYASSSFAGLDGFNKMPQNMSAARPMGGYMGAPGQPAMGMGMGMAPRGAPMGAGYGAPAPAPVPQGYGAPHQGFPPQQPQQGYGAPAPMGGYGAPQQGYLPQQQQQQQGYGAPAPMGGGFGGPMGGAPGYGAPGPAMGAMGGAPGYPPQQQGYRPSGPGGFGAF